jgi:hypothetical protein
LVQKQSGVSLEKMDFLVDILLICFQAMKESGVTWPLTEEEQERQMGRFVATVHFGDDLPGSLRVRALKQYIEAHLESELLAFVNVETADWLQRVVPDESDKYVVMAAFNFVNCIAVAPMPAQKRPLEAHIERKSDNVLVPGQSLYGERWRSLITPPSPAKDYGNSYAEENRA